MSLHLLLHPVNRYVARFLVFDSVLWLLVAATALRSLFLALGKDPAGPARAVRYAVFPLLAGGVFSVLVKLTIDENTWEKGRPVHLHIDWSWLFGACGCAALVALIVGLKRRDAAIPRATSPTP